jgi:uncharacterized protein YcfL
VLAGCAQIDEGAQSAAHTVATGHEGGAYKPVNTSKYDLENHEAVVLLDKGVEHSVTVDGVQQDRMGDGRMKVSANVRNRENRRIQVQINCVFKDAGGFSTGDETVWQNLILTENAQETVSLNSMNSEAKKFTVRIRQAR